MSQFLRSSAVVALIFASIVPSGVAEAATRCSPDPIACCTLRAASNVAKASDIRFGVQVWPSGLRGQPSTIDQLLALKPRALRFSLGPNWRKQGAITDSMRDEELDAYVHAGLSSSRIDDDVQMMADIQRRTQADLHLVVWEPPPLPTETRLTQPLKDRILRRQDAPLMGRFLVALLKQIERRELPIKAIELTNEPDGNWNIHIAPPDYVALVTSVRDEARRRGVRLPAIYGPGTSTLTALNDYLSPSETAKTIINSVDVLSTHGWEADRGSDRFVEFEKLLRTLADLHLRPQLAITEYGIARPIPNDRADRNNLKKRVRDTIADTPFLGSLSARDLLRFYSRGITTAIAWEFSDQPWGRSSFGLLDGQARPRPIYGAMRTISERLTVTPKEISGAAEGLFITEQDGDAELWGANPTAKPLTVVFTDNYRPTGTPVCEDDSGHAGMVIPPLSLTLTSIEKH